MLIGKKLAIVSVGISCQTATQIQDHAAQIRKLADEDLEDVTTPFDWILCGARSAADMIRAEDFYPTVFEGPLLDPKPYWGERNVHYWHSKTEKPADFLAKWGHIAGNWKRIHGADRRIFVISNTQNNVGRVLADRQPIETRLLWDHIVLILEALLHKFGGNIELHVVTRNGLDDYSKPSAFMVGFRPWLTIHKIGRDPSQWSGNGKAWARLFENILR